MLDAIAQELHIRHSELEISQVPSVYFGGGTPSILEPDEIQKLLDDVSRFYSIGETTELTLEANPDDLDAKFLKGIVKAGINRLSIGTQSFDDRDLKMMNRAHHAEQAESSIKRAQDIGIENISIDLIYGSPTSDFEVWKQNLQKTIELQVPHVSSYALTVEPKTILENWIEKGKIKAPKEVEQNKEFYYMIDFLKDHGFDHYEISNFGKPGFHSEHNSAYWESHPYLGLGPSAHSYDGKNTRSWNVANNAKYVKALQENTLPIEREILSDKDQYNERLMIGLRTAKGVDMQRLKEEMNDEIAAHYQHSVQQKLDDGKLIVEDGFLKIPEKDWFFADGIASDLFIL